MFCLSCTIDQSRHRGIQGRPILSSITTSSFQSNITTCRKLNVDLVGMLRVFLNYFPKNCSNKKYFNSNKTNQNETKNGWDAVQIFTSNLSHTCVLIIPMKLFNLTAFFSIMIQPHLTMRFDTSFLKSPLLLLISYI